MPSLNLFGRKWLVAADDMVFPGFFEIVFRSIWLVLMVLVCLEYYHVTWDCNHGGEFVRAYIIGIIVHLGVNILLLVLLVNRSAQGSIMDTNARKYVPLILTIKILLIIPEVAWNIMGTIWSFSNLVLCHSNKNFTMTTIEGLVIFNWVLLALTIFGLAFVFDPLGSSSYSEEEEAEMLYHRKVTRLWMRRFQWIFCWIRRDEHSREAFQHVASLFSALLRNTDLVPSDMMAAMVLLRVMQKRESRELRRLQVVTEEQAISKGTSDATEILADVPSWMSLEKACHFLKLSIAAYGWPFVMYRYPATGLFRLCKRMTCCACFRNLSTTVKNDNCCLCHLAGVKYMSELATEDVLYASFQNDLFQLPFFVTLDHKTESIAVVIRGSISLRDVFTDLTAGADYFKAPGLPANSMAHRGMIAGAVFIKKHLEGSDVLEKALNLYPNYKLILTGHSLGAGVAVLLALLIRPKYPDVKVYAISPPAGLLSREASRITEEFTFSVGVGDDFVMRLGVDSMENIRTNALRVLKFCKLPKYRIMLNGFGYALFGIPPHDLESTWKSDVPPPSIPGQLPLLLGSPQSTPLTDSLLFVKDITQRRFSSIHLYTPGRILHITRRKKSRIERRAGSGGPTYEMRWAVAEEFTEFRIMPRMLLDHLPENVYDTLETVLKEQELPPISIL